MINKNIFPLTLLLCLIISSGYAQNDSVIVRTSEEAADSTGPWTLSRQYIDSIDQNGRVSAKLTRVHNGISWINMAAEEFQYSALGELVLNISSLWDGSTFIPQNKTERNFDSTGRILSEIFSLFNSGNWIYSGKKEYTYSALTNEKEITEYSYAGGSWLAVNRYLQSFNAHDQILSDLFLMANGLSWDTIRIKKYYYSLSTAKLTRDSVLYFSPDGLLPYQASVYHYNLQGNPEFIRTHDLQSWFYSDADTTYLICETDFEYTITFTYDQSGNLIEKLGSQTGGTSQNLTFEHNYFQYNSDGQIAGHFMHRGSNIQDNFQRSSSHYFETLSVVFTPTAPSCHTCSDGSVGLKIEGGVPAYTVQINSTQALIQNDKVENLSAGVYQICITDQLDNRLFVDVSLENLSTDISTLNKDNQIPEIIKENDKYSLILHSGKNETVQLNLYDQEGRNVIQQQIQGNGKINADNLSTGIYFYSIQSTDRIFSGKILITR